MAVRGREHGQVLVLLAILMTLLLAFAGITIDIGRQLAERRHLQNAADAAALAACRALVAGQTDSAAAQAARAVAMINLENSPTGTSVPIADDLHREYADGHAGDPAYLTNGIFISGTSVRVALDADLPTVLARVVGVGELGVGAQSRCMLQASPAVPIVARRYTKPPGPGNGFVDHLATAFTSGDGQVDALDPRGYDGGARTIASEAEPGPVFSIYGNESKAGNASDFRGFVALDIRNFESDTSRQYYNEITAGTNASTIKDIEGAYLVDGYKGPAFPAVDTPPDGDTQVAVIPGNNTSFVVHQFDDQFEVGERLLLGVYDGTVMSIPDFSIVPPLEIALPSTTTAPFDGPTFRVTRNNAFYSTVTLNLRGDASAALTGHPEYDIVPDPSVTPPAAGDMSEPIWSTDVFIPASGSGTTVAMNDIQTNAIPPGIYTVWLEGHSGVPYDQDRRVPVPVRVQTDANNDGDYSDVGDVRTNRDFSLLQSTLSGTTAALNGTIVLPVVVSTTSASSTRWAGGSGLETPVTLSWDTDSLTDCALDPVTLGMASISLSATSVTPAPSGPNDPADSTVTIDTLGLPGGCYQFALRGTGTNGYGQPVTHLQTVRFTVATTTAGGEYVDVIGFAVFEVTGITSNDINGQAVTGIYANPSDSNLRRAQLPRLVPWN